MTTKVLGVLAILAVFVVGSAAMALEIVPGSLGDRVWWDQDKDGVQDAGEPGIVGATVELWQGGLVPLARQQTGADGYYLFTGLDSGTYQVRVTSLPAAPNGGTWVQTYDLTAPTTDSLATRTLIITGTTEPGDPIYDPYGDGVTLALIEHARDVDFGYATVSNQSALGAIGDYVWNDLDKDGVQDGGEPPISGAVVELTQDTNHTGLFGDVAVYNGEVLSDVVLTQTTNTNGLYLFDNLPAGNYRVIVQSLPAPPSGTTWQQTFDKDDGNVVAPATFFTPNEMANQLLASHDVYENGLWSTAVDRVLDVDFGYVYKTTQTTPFVTYTQGGWGAKPAGNNPGMLLKNNWTVVAGLNPLVVGTGTYKITLTTAKAVENFLPQGGTAGRLTRNWTNPTTKTEAGVFAGQVTALKLSVLFSNAGITTSGLADLKAASGPLAGKTVSQILAICEAALSGGATGYTYAQLNEVATAINENFDNGTINNGYLIP